MKPADMAQIIDQFLDDLINRLNSSSQIEEMVPIADLLTMKFRSSKIITALVNAIQKFDFDSVPEQLVYYASECPPEDTVNHFQLWIDLVCRGDYSVALNAYHILSEIDDPESLTGDIVSEAENKLRSVYNPENDKSIIIKDLLGMFD